MREGWSRRASELTTRRAEAEWIGQARGKQYRPGPVGESWLVIGGRGSGKTRLGAEWVNCLVKGYLPFTLSQYGQIALVGETLADVREVMIDGPAGIRTIARGERPAHEVTRRRLVWRNGAVAQMFSSEDPDSLRGPQFEAAWCDELGKWKNDEACFDMLQFGLRLGVRPLQLMTTTPRPTQLMKRLIADQNVTVTRMRTSDNAANLAKGFLRTVEQRYGGTRLGRQELDGEMIEDRVDALWSRAMLEAAVRPVDDETLRRIVVAVDPPASSGKRSDACGIVVAALGADGTGVVLADGTLKSAKPQDWASAAVGLFHRFEADCIVAETNQGGEMVSAVIASVDPLVPVRAVRAKRGKWLRAEPVAALYQQGRVAHAARFPDLEDEMCDFGPAGLSNGRSPDRLDALVWAISELMLGTVNTPRIRGLV